VRKLTPNVKTTDPRGDSSSDKKHAAF